MAGMDHHYTNRDPGDRNRYTFLFFLYYLMARPGGSKRHAGESV